MPSLREAWPTMSSPMDILHREERWSSLPRQKGMAASLVPFRWCFITAVYSSSGVLTVLLKLFWTCCKINKQTHWIGSSRIPLLFTKPILHLPWHWPGSHWCSCVFLGVGDTRMWACVLCWHLNMDHSAIHIVTGNVTVEFLIVLTQLRAKGQFASGFMFHG